MLDKVRPPQHEVTETAYRVDVVGKHQQIEDNPRYVLDGDLLQYDAMAVHTDWVELFCPFLLTAPP